MTTSREARHSSKSNEYYTPSEIVWAAYETMGSIDLDPASSGSIHQHIFANTYYTESDNGLSKIWRGNVFLNPPYGWTYVRTVRQGAERMERISSQALWSKRLMRWFDKGYVTNAILLVNAETGSSWFDPFWRFPICFPKERIHFVLPDGSRANQPTHSNAIICLTKTGRIVERFNESFSNFGSIVVRYSDLMGYMGMDIK